MPNVRLRRSSTDSWLGGVCGGLSQAFGMESWVWRLIFTCGFLLVGIGLILYILLWIFTPLDTSRSSLAVTSRKPWVRDLVRP